MKLAKPYVEHLHGAVFIYVDTHNQDSQLNTQRAQGVLVSPDREDLTIYIAESQSSVLLANLVDNGKLSLTVTNPLTSSAYLFNGTYMSHGPSDSKDRVIQSIYLYKLNAALHPVRTSMSDYRDPADLEPMVSILISINEIVELVNEKISADIQRSS
jgi:secreted trypsin-like serine protease